MRLGGIAALGGAARAEPTAAAAPASVPNLAALSARDPAGTSPGVVVAALGFAEPGDGGGGLFWWDPEAESAPDGGTILAPDTRAGRGRWRRLVDGDWRAEWFGVRADGVADDGPALARAIDAAAGRVLVLPKGLIRIAAPLAVSAPSWHLRGQQPERGQYGRNNGTVLDAAGIGRGRWLVERYDAEPPLHETIGPFAHENLDIRLGEANGFAFGRAAAEPGAAYNPVRDRAGQKYVHGVRFRGCRITGGIARHASGPDGRIARSGQQLIRLVKCFESTIEDCALVGGDVQIETWGCDAPLVRHVRSNNSHLPIFMRRSGSFAVSHRVSAVEIESWTFGAIVSEGVMLEAGDLRFEPNVAGSRFGTGRFDMTAALGITAAVRAGSDAVLFSGDASGLLFPGLSLVEFADETGNSDVCLVTAVAGREARVWTAGFAFTWSAETARAVRIHGYGLLHGGAFDASLANGHPDPFRDCPAFVYRPDNGSMFIAGMGKVPGSNGDVRSLALGNLVRDAGGPRRRMAFTGCSPTVLADPVHPFVTVDAPLPSPDGPELGPPRRTFTPRTWAAEGLPFRMVRGPHAQRLPAWLLRPGDTLAVPPGSERPVRASVTARALDHGATLSPGPGHAAAELGRSWETAVFRLDGSATPLDLAASADVLVAAVLIEPE